MGYNDHIEPDPARVEKQRYGGDLWNELQDVPAGTFTVGELAQILAPRPKYQEGFSDYEISVMRDMLALAKADARKP